MSKRFTSDKPSFAEIRALRKPRTHTVWVPLDADLLRRINDLERELRMAERQDEVEHRDPEAPRIRAELDRLRDEAEVSAISFTFTELPRRQYQSLIKANPPLEKGMRWNEETFAPTLIAASCLAPEMTAEEAAEVCASWSEYHYALLFGAAYLAQEGETKIPPFVTATGATPGSG